MSKLYRILSAAIAVAICVGCGKPEQEDNTKPSDGATPDAPAGLVLHNSTETSLTFQWNSVAGATSYSYVLKKGTATVTEGSVKVRNVKIENLAKGTEYVFTVCSVAGEYKSSGTSLTVKTEGEQNTDPGNDDPSGIEVTYADFEIPAVEEDGKARAFPGAEGGGMYTTGGRGGTVYHVTSLADDGSKGSLRYGLSQSGKRTIVFDVAGRIDLRSKLNITKGDVTIAGQTAPGDGICISGYPVQIAASNVIIRFIRFRMGDVNKTEDDALQIMSHTDDVYSNIIIDHCSVSWSTDECASFYGMKDFTFQWHIVSESLRNSIHDKGPHGYGGIWGGTNATYHHNLLAHHDSRNPRIDHDYVSTQKGPVTISNNVVYNWEGNTCYGGESYNNSNTYRQYNFINNYYKPGPVTPSSHIWLLNPTVSCDNCSKMSVYPDKSTIPSGYSIVPGHFYMDGNIMYGKSDITSNNWKAGESTSVGVRIDANKVSSIKESTPFECNAMSVHSAQTVFEQVLTYAGASYSRDVVDERIADETRRGAFTYEGSNTDPKKKTKDAQGNEIWVSVERSYKGLIDTQSDVGGWPAYEASEADLNALRDSDGDGIPDEIEDSWGLNKNNASDGGTFTLDPKKRYTNLEMYLHYLVKDIVAQGNKGSDYIDL